MTVSTASETVLVARNLRRHYLIRQSFLKTCTVKALEDVSLNVLRSKTLAVVGESGCGKSTLARLLTSIEIPTSGTLLIDGHDIAHADRTIRKSLRHQVQMVFQNPFASLNPRKTIEATLAEPLIINTPLDSTARKQRIDEVLETVGLRPEQGKRYPHMFSGGQHQRIAIARAMMLKPSILVADEPVSALDVSIQAQILNLFMDLQEKFGTSYVFISHNLSVVEHIAHNVMVMYFGRAVEMGDKTVLFTRARHPYTRMLISATPTLHASDKRIQIPVRGELPSPLDPPSGCVFHPRCPYAIDRCRREIPLLREVDDRLVACHRAEEVEN